MALTATFDLTKNPPELTVTSDRRKVDVDIHSAGDTTTCHGVFPVTVTDRSGREWTLKSDDDLVAVYTG